MRERLQGEPNLAWRPIEGTLGHIGEGRYRGFQLGTAPFLTFVDPDDVLHAGAIGRCVEALKQHPNAAVALTREVLQYDTHAFCKPLDLYQDAKHDSILLAGVTHHLVVYRREMVEPFFSILRDHPLLPEPHFHRAIAEYHDFVFVPEIGYRWRIHAGNTSVPGGWFAKRWPDVFEAELAAYRTMRETKRPLTHGLD